MMNRPRTALVMDSEDWPEKRDLVCRYQDPPAGANPWTCKECGEQSIKYQYLVDSKDDNKTTTCYRYIQHNDVTAHRTTERTMHYICRPMTAVW